MTFGPDGVVLVRRPPEIVQQGVFKLPDESEVDAALLAAATGALEGGTPPDTTQPAGTSYMVRLACGGIAYVFEPGQAKHAIGGKVLVEWGLMPRLVPR